MGASELLDTAARREFVLRLRRKGKTYRAIAAAALAEFGPDRLPNGWDCRYAYMDVKRELDKLREVVGEHAEDVRQLELLRLDAMLDGLWERARAGKATAVDRVLKIMERRARLLGLDAPTRQEVTGKDGEPLLVRFVWDDPSHDPDAEAAQPDPAADDHV